MIALDALDGELLRRLMREGKLPNLGRFTGESQALRVQSDGLTLHGSLWPTFASGTGPGVHGRYFWTQWLAEEMRHVRSSHPAFDYVPFWAQLARAGVTATVIDAPYAPLVEEPTVRQYIAWGTHDEMEPGAWPKAWGKEFRRRFGKHPLEFDTVEPQTLKEKLAMAQTLRRGVGIRARALEATLAETSSQFVLCVFGETHKAGHYLSAPQLLKPGISNVDAIERILQPLDDAWPGIEAAAGPGACIILFALHGTREQVDFSSALGGQLLALALGKAPAAERRPDLVRRVRDLLPDAVHRAIWRRLPPRLRAARHGLLSGAGNDPSHDALLTVAHDGHLALRMNLANRERDGIATAAEADAALRALEALATEFRMPDGMPAFLPLLYPPAAFPGPRAFRLPDALLMANDQVTRAHTLKAADGRELTAHNTEARNGVHTGDGFCYIGGMRQKLSRETAIGQDFAPSTMQLFGLPPGSEFEGSSFIA